jgi:ATP phosphoribosyltransferase
VLRENARDFDAQVRLVAPLGFGRADLVVAAPARWADVTTMADLAEVAAEYRARQGRRLRVATKYVRSAARFFAAHGVADHRVVESLGATEGAPAAGVAEVIVDITTTGATLAANGLKILADGLILKSQAQLAASRNARWDSAALDAAKPLLAAVAADRAGDADAILRTLKS